ncbi:response regulator [bacterium]|nr:response regulator [bacterium]
MLKVLFVDDQVEMLKPLLNLVKNLLKDVTILAESSGAAGLERARVDKPDMIFLDISMPGMDGYEVCRRLRQSTQTESVPILFLSSMDLTMKEQLEAFELGAVDFLRKPIQSVELATRIRVVERLNNYTQHLEELVAEQTQKIEKQQLLAARTQRLAAMGTLAAGIAHEINQPLNALKVTADGLLYWKDRDEHISEEEVFDGLRFISKQCFRIESIINNMRDLVQQGSGGEMVSVDTHNVIEQALSLIGQQLMSHGIEIVRHFEQGLPHCLGSQTALEQVVLNLLTNGMNALDSIQSNNKQLVIETRSDAELVTIRVIDNGPGIPEEKLESIFDPFYTSSPATEGMGLGLSITQNLIVSMRGSLAVENVEGGGASFIITLPRASA